MVGENDDKELGAGAFKLWDNLSTAYQDDVCEMV